MRVVVLLMLTLNLCAVHAGNDQTSSEARVPLPVLPPAAGSACVEPVEIMRKEHMHMLMHQRDRTVHQAYRDPRHSLKGCVDCHVQRDAAGRTIAVDAPGQFCAQCHAYTAVTMDCFECHASTPDSGRRDSGVVDNGRGKVGRGNGERRQ